LSLPATLAAADWLCLTRPVSQHGRAHLLQPMALAGVVMGVGLGWLGLLLASASLAVRGTADAHLVADVAGSGGVLGAALATLMALALWASAAPLVFIWSPARALLSLAPRLASAPRAAALAAGVLFVLVPLMALLPEAWGAAALGGLLLGVA